jgi:predicted tellurium resistance membrane protein TerC
MEHLLTSESLIALLTLTGLEIVLGIDNIVFVSILVGKLPRSEQARARRVGLLLAMGMRILLLLGISWVIGLTAPLFALLGRDVTGRDLVLIVGGLFLVAKATWEIHDKLEGDEHGPESARVAPTFGAILVQIALLDIVFSLDSVITAVGMARHVEIMIAAVVIAVGVMMVFAGAVGAFIERHPTLKMLALSFLLLIGVVLVADGVGQHVAKGTIYFAMAFSLFVEILNIRIRGRRAQPVHLHQSYVRERER